MLELSNHLISSTYSYTIITLAYHEAAVAASSVLFVLKTLGGNRSEQYVARVTPGRLRRLFPIFKNRCMYCIVCRFGMFCYFRDMGGMKEKKTRTFRKHFDCAPAPRHRN